MLYYRRAKKRLISVCCCIKREDKQATVFKNKVYLYTSEFFSQKKIFS